ncbi:GNAT domain-containing protein [Haematococcus lacustris]
MLDNANLTLTGTRCKLVPYRSHHVETYNRWMQDPHLQQTTESEPLSIEEEYAMQASWRDDEAKCTFIILDTSQPDTPGTGQHGGMMAGDVNLYLNDPDSQGVAEIEVMVAEPACRRRGIAREALQLVQAYAVQRLAVVRFRAKVLEDNEPSLRLFKQLGYSEARRVQVFKEVHLELGREDGAHWEQLHSLHLHCGAYDNTP